MCLDSSVSLSNEKNCREISKDKVIFSKIELETAPFLTVIQFYGNVDKKRVGKSPQEISTWRTFRNILTNLKRTR